MKKLTALLLAAAMALALAACGGGDAPMTKDEMLEQAVALDNIKFNNDFFNNIVNAKEQYSGKIMITANSSWSAVLTIARPLNALLLLR